MQNYEVGQGQPLLGTISGLERRRLYLILVDNDGLVHRLETKVDPSGDSATFSVPLTADAGSIGPMQMLLAIASDKPIPALDTLHSANLKLIGSRLVDDARRASASVEADVIGALRPDKRQRERRDQWKYGCFLPLFLSLACLFGWRRSREVPRKRRSAFARSIMELLHELEFI